MYKWYGFIFMLYCYLLILIWKGSERRFLLVTNYHLDIYVYIVGKQNYRFCCYWLMYVCIKTQSHKHHFWLVFVYFRSMFVPINTFHVAINQYYSFCNSFYLGFKINLIKSNTLIHIWFCGSFILVLITILHNLDRAITRV